MHSYPVNGAAARVGNQETAWSYRDATWAMVIVGIDPDAANDELITNWARNYWHERHPHGAGGGYVNLIVYLINDADTSIRNGPIALKSRT